MSGRSTIVRTVATVLAVVLGIAISSCSKRDSAVEPVSRGPLAVVLAPTSDGTRLVVVDVDTFRVVRTTKLRSLVTDIDVDEERGRVVTAQTGGIGERADRAVGIFDPRSGRIRYVPLAVPDPVNVVCRGGIAYVLHSVVTSDGLVCSIVDVGRGTLMNTTRAPDGPGVWASSHEGIWTLRAGEGDWTAVRLDPVTLAVSAEATGDVRVSGVGETATGTVVLGSLARGARTAAAAFLDGDGTMSAAVGLPDLRYPARIAALAGGRFVVGDWAGQSPEPVMLTVLDSATLRPQRSIRVPGGPCAIAGYGTNVLVVERSAGRLVEIDPGTGATLRSLSLGTGELLVSDIVVLPVSAER